MNLDLSFGASLASVLSISESNLISLISIQLFLVEHIISKRVGMVTKKSYGLTKVMRKMEVTALICTFNEGSLSLSAK